MEVIKNVTPKFIFAKKDDYFWETEELLKNREVSFDELIEADNLEAVYTTEQVMEFAKAKMVEALKACLQIKIPGRSNGKSKMIAEQFKNIIDSIFEEDKEKPIKADSVKELNIKFTYDKTGEEFSPHSIEYEDVNHAILANCLAKIIYTENMRSSCFSQYILDYIEEFIKEEN